MKFKVINSKNYRLFKNIEVNRDINDARVMELSDSINRIGLLNEIIVVIMDGIYVILDGGHRFEAIKRISGDVRAKVLLDVKTTDEMLEIMRDLNTNVVKWVTDNFSRIFAKQQNINYQYYEMFKKNYGSIIPNDAISQILAFDGGSGFYSRQFKKGDFVVGNVETAAEIFDNLIAYKPYIKTKSGGIHIKFIQAYLNVIKRNVNFSATRFLEAVMRQPNEFKGLVQPLMFEAKIIDVYNNGLRYDGGTYTRIS